MRRDHAGCKSRRLLRRAEFRSAVGTKERGRWGPGPRCEARGIVSRSPKKVVPRSTRSLPACARVFRTVEGPTDCGYRVGRGMRGRSCCPLLAAECLGIRWTSTAPLVAIGGNSALGEENGMMTGVPDGESECASVARHCRHSCAWEEMRYSRGGGRGRDSSSCGLSAGNERSYVSL